MRGDQFGGAVFTVRQFGVLMNVSAPGDDLRFHRSRGLVDRVVEFVGAGLARRGQAKNQGHESRQPDVPEDRTACPLGARP